MMDKKDKDELIYGLIGLLIVALFSLFTSCRARIRYIPIGSSTDSIYIDKLLPFGKFSLNLYRDFNLTIYNYFLRW